jgi:hypothetical protein
LKRNSRKGEQESRHGGCGEELGHNVPIVYQAHYGRIILGLEYARETCPMDKRCATQKWRSGGPRLPVVLKLAIELAAAEGENGVSPADSPEHPGLFEAFPDHGFAASLA